MALGCFSHGASPNPLFVRLGFVFCVLGPVSAPACVCAVGILPAGCSAPLICPRFVQVLDSPKLLANSADSVIMCAGTCAFASASKCVAFWFSPTPLGQFEGWQWETLCSQACCLDEAAMQ